MSTPNIPLPSEGALGVQPGGRATATCFCGAVQLLLIRPFPSSMRMTHLLTHPWPVQGPHFSGAFICDYTHDHKFHASAFASNFIVDASATTLVRGEDKMTIFAQTKIIATWFHRMDGAEVHQGGHYNGAQVAVVGVSLCVSALTDCHTRIFCFLEDLIVSPLLRALLIV